MWRAGAGSEQDAQMMKFVIVDLPPVIYLFVTFCVLVSVRVIVIKGIKEMKS